jgi:integrase
MGSVYKREDSNKWWITYRVGGRRVREAGGATKAQAQLLLAKRETEVFEGRFFPEKKLVDLTVGVLRDQWLERSKWKKSIADDRHRFKTIVKVLGRNTRVIALSTKDIERLKSTLAELPTRRGASMKPASVNRHLALLKSALRYAQACGHSVRVPSQALKMVAEHNVRDRICAEDEYTLLTEHAFPSLRLAIVFAFHTGMRLGEIVSLKWEQIDWADRVIKLRAEQTKTGQARAVPFNQIVERELAQLPRHITGSVLGVKSSASLSPAFTRLCRRIGIKDLHFHDLRHTFATNMRRAGADLFTIAAITGHKSLEMLRRYNTVTVEDMHSALDRVRHAT